MTASKAKICYLHIGAEKTGSTSIQAFLAANRPRLRDQGYLFPQTPGHDNQPALAAYAMEDISRSKLMAQVGVKTDADFAAFRERFAADLKAEAASSGADKIILTNEHCHSRIETSAQLTRLAALLHDIADDVRVIFYLRRQDRAATSLYSTALKVGQWRKKPDLQVRCCLPLAFDYWRSCQLFEQVFGREAMDVRLFEKNRFHGGDLIQDFCMATGLPIDVDWQKAESQNRSLGRLGQRFLAAFNHDRQTRFGEKSEHYRMALVRQLDTHFSGKSLMPSRAAAEAFLAQFTEGNEALRRAYFSDHAAPLFGDDFTMYPEEEPDWMPGPLRAFEIGAKLFVAQQDEIDRLKAELDAIKKAED